MIRNRHLALLFVSIGVLITFVLSGTVWRVWRPHPQSFSTAQRAEILEIVRTALQQNPDILRDAISAQQSEDSDRQDFTLRSVIEHSRTALIHEPGDPTAGNPSGDVTIVEFYDVNCPFCRAMAPIVAQLIASDNKVRVVYKDLPVLGPNSVLEAQLLLAAQRQDGYFKLQSALMTMPEPSAVELSRTARLLGLNWGKLQKDMKDPDVQRRLSENFRLADLLGVEGTPTFIIGDQEVQGSSSLAILRADIVQARQRTGSTE